MMMRTTNPIESCMSSLCRRMSGLGCAREANLFNHYRILVTWMILRMKTREVLSGGKAVVLLVEGGRTDGTWIVRHVIMRAHHVQCYKEWYLVRLVSGGDLDVGNWNERVYKVRDCGHDGEYTVDLSDPCSCHRSHWAKTPCVHVILHLDSLKQWWKVWDCVGDDKPKPSVQFWLRRHPVVCSRMQWKGSCRCGDGCSISWNPSQRSRL